MALIAVAIMVSGCGVDMDSQKHIDSAYPNCEGIKDDETAAAAVIAEINRLDWKIEVSEIGEFEKDGIFSVDLRGKPISLGTKFSYTEPNEEMLRELDLSGDVAVVLSERKKALVAFLYIEKDHEGNSLNAHRAEICFDLDINGEARFWYEIDDLGRPLGTLGSHGRGGGTGTD